MKLREDILEIVLIFLATARPVPALTPPVPHPARDTSPIGPLALTFSQTTYSNISRGKRP